MSAHIALVEDDPLIAANYREALEKQGFRVSTYDSLSTASTALAIQLPDLALIDVGLADDSEGGFELCRQLRAASPLLPIVFLTARDDEWDIISGLRLGADDYLSKGISFAQLSARLHALLRRASARRDDDMPSALISVGSLTLDSARMIASWRSQAVDLTVTEFWIVHSLAKHPGHVKNRQQLMEAASVVLDDNTITSHIKRIRKKFLVLDDGFQAIETAYGLGYRWLGDCP